MVSNLVYKHKQKANNQIPKFKKIITKNSLIQLQTYS